MVTKNRSQQVPKVSRVAQAMPVDAAIIAAATDWAEYSIRGTLSSGHITRCHNPADVDTLRRITADRPLPEITTAYSRAATAILDVPDTAAGRVEVQRRCDVFNAAVIARKAVICDTTADPNLMGADLLAAVRARRHVFALLDVDYGWSDPIPTERMLELAAVMVARDADVAPLTAKGLWCVASVLAVEHQSGVIADAAFAAEWLEAKS